MMRSWWYPPGPLLFANKCLDNVLRPFVPKWRSYVPFGVGGGILSFDVGDVPKRVPRLLSYSAYCRRQDGNSLYEYAFRTPSTELASLTTPASLMTLLVLVGLFRACKSILLPVFSDWGRRLGTKTHGPKWQAANPERIVKFSEYVFRLLYHSIISVYGLVYFSNKPWWNDTTLFFQGYPNQEVHVGMIWYYLIQSAYNVEALISLLILSVHIDFFPRIQVKKTPNCRGDFREMAIHHLVTNALIVVSSHFGLTRVGSLVFLVHDVSDVPVDLSKLFNFLKWKKSTIGFFLLMVIVWAVTRLYIFPVKIVRSCVVDSYLLVANMGVEENVFYAYFWIFYTLLGMLLLLHLLWFGMMIRIGWYLIRKGEPQDLSEHEEGQDQGGAVVAVNDVTSNAPVGYRNGSTVTKEKCL